MNIKLTANKRIAALAALALPVAAHAAPVTWGTWNAVSDNTAISVLGGFTTVEGVNLNGASTTINNGTTDVSFVGIARNASGTAAGITVANSGFAFDSTGNNSNVVSAVGSPVTWGTVLDQVIGDFDGGATITLSGLTSGDSYYVQFFSSTPDANINQNTVISSGGVDSAAFGGHTGGETRSIIATFTADGPSQAFTISGEEPTFSALVMGVEPAGPVLTPPLITSTTPVYGASSVPLTTDLIIVFDETVQKGAGNIYVRTGGSPVQTIDVTTAAVTLGTTNVTDDTVTVDISDLSIDTDYAIQIDAGAFEDTEVTDFAGIGDDTTWNFSTSTPPPSSIVSFSAVNGTTGPNTPPTLDNSFGTLEMALNLGNGSGGTLDLNGITFTNNNVTSATNTVTWASVSGISVGATTDVGATWSVATNIVSGSPGPSSLYNNTFGTEAWSNKSGGGTFQTINISGLDAGKSYQIQLMHGEDRSIGNGFDYAGTLVATDDNSNTAEVFFRFGDENDQNTYVFGLVTLVVSGTSSVDILYPDRSVAASGDRDPSIAGIVIHSADIVTDPFMTWAGTGTLGPVTFEGDTNGDGVQDGLAFLLGAADPDVDANASNLLPTVSESGGNLVMEFDCLATVDRGSAVLNLEYDGDLVAPWLSALVPGAVGDPNPIVANTATGIVSFVATANGSLIHIVATISDASESAGGKLFGRLLATE